MWSIHLLSRGWGLADGQTTTATMTLIDANGAHSGNRDTVTVTVNGATAVPALPRVGQIILALLLMAGAARRLSEV